MNALANQYSYILIALVVLIGVMGLLRLLRVNRRITTLAAAAILVIAGTAWIVLRPGMSDVNSVEAAEAIIDNGQPTFVEFFSNYCAGCLAARPAVDALISDIQTKHAEDFNILRVDIHTEFGRVLREHYGFSYTPEFVLFDHSGREIWRSHSAPTLAQIEAVANGA